MSGRVDELIGLKGNWPFDADNGEIVCQPYSVSFACLRASVSFASNPERKIPHQGFVDAAGTKRR